MRVDSQQERDSHNACVCVFLSVSFSLLCCDSWPVASETAIGVVGTHFPSVLLLGLCLGIFPQNLVKYLNFSCCVGYPWNCLRVLGWLSWLLLFVFWFESGFGSLAIHDFDRRDISVEWFDSVSLSGVVGIRHEKESLSFRDEHNGWDFVVGWSPPAHLKCCCSLILNLTMLMIISRWIFHPLWALALFVVSVAPDNGSCLV